MILDALEAENLSSSFSSLQRVHYFSKADLQCRHNALQSSLQSLADYFSRLAWSINNTERAMLDPRSQQEQAASKWKGSGYVDGSLEKLLKGKKFIAEGNQKYEAGGSSAVVQSDHLFGVADLEVLPVGIKGKAEAVLKDKNGNFNPSVILSGTAGAAALHGQVNAGLKLGKQNIGVQGGGQCLVAYGSAEVAFAPDEVKVDLQAGAAVARGECSVVVELFGYRITAGVSGSLGAAEAGLGFEYSTREWSFGCKLGFIIGAGVNARVEKIR